MNPNQEEEKVRAQLRAQGQSISTPNTPRNKGLGAERETDIGTRSVGKKGKHDYSSQNDKEILEQELTKHLRKLCSQDKERQSRTIPSQPIVQVVNLEPEPVVEPEPPLIEQPNFQASIQFGPEEPVPPVKQQYESWPPSEPPVEPADHRHPGPIGPPKRSATAGLDSHTSPMPPRYYNDVPVNNANFSPVPPTPVQPPTQPIGAQRKINFEADQMAPISSKPLELKAHEGSVGPPGLGFNPAVGLGPSQPTHSGPTMVSPIGPPSRTIQEPKPSQNAPIAPIAPPVSRKQENKPVLMVPPMPMQPSMMGLSPDFVQQPTSDLGAFGAMVSFSKSESHAGEWFLCSA